MHRAVLAALACGLALSAACTGPEFQETELEREVRDIQQRMFPELPPPPEKRSGNVGIVVERIAVDRREASAIGLAWRYVDEHAAIAGGDLARRNGLRIGVTKDGFAAQLHASLEKARNKSVSKMMLTTLSGQPAAIEVGRQTYVELLRYRTRRGERVVLQKAFVGGSMMALPEITGDNVRLRLYPRLTTRDGRTVHLTEATTTLVVPHGRPVLLGGMEQASQSAGGALFTWGARQQHRNVTVLVTPYIQAAP
jgi:hypothetical protein